MDKPPSSGVPKGTLALDFRPLQAYLKKRFADTVVLTFTQIEDLIGSALPTSARAEAAWWANTDSTGALSEQSSAWMQADRLATANLSAQTVAFARR
ncbi:MAG TPA: hypothetical protein VLA20_12550 [Vicinamibacterales bacterium]|nr:hypothetical protein [Vicinamibacterales bacterium]